MERIHLYLGIRLLLLAWTITACTFSDLFDRQPTPEPPIMSNEATIVGMVVENVQACAYDADCYLLVDTGAALWKILYGEGRREPTADRPLCIENGDASAMAFRLAVGDEVAVFARVVEDHVLETCSMPEYSIRLIRPAADVGSEVTITGVVVDTIDHCTVDGICALVIDASDGRYTVIYNPGATMCTNPNVPGEPISLGDTVEVFAVVTGNFELYTCPSEAYHISRVR